MKLERSLICKSSAHISSHPFEGRPISVEKEGTPKDHLPHVVVESRSQAIGVRGERCIRRLGDGTPGLKRNSKPLQSGSDDPLQAPRWIYHSIQCEP